MKSKIKLFKWLVFIETDISHCNSPLDSPLNKRREFAREIDRETGSMSTGYPKLRRVKATLQIGRSRSYVSHYGHNRFGLRDAKAFVELAFHDYGSGEMK